jgi:hypothetical protein
LIGNAVGAESWRQCGMMIGEIVAIKPPEKHAWAFAPRFRCGAFGWRSQPAITRIKEAVTEIKKLARKQPLLAADGAVLFLEKLSPALQNIDSSSGAIGSAVNRAIDELAIIIVAAPVGPDQRATWLERLYEAHADDQVPYIECLGDYWGELCVFPELASEWADRLLGLTEMSWRPGPAHHGYFSGTIMCLSALLHAGRHEQLLALIDTAPYRSWTYRQWGVKALVAQRKTAEALQYAESSAGRNDNPIAIASACEEILLSTGMADEAYRRFAIASNSGSTYLGTFRTIAKKYPHKSKESILHDLVASTPMEPGKWFAAAKDAGLLELALDLANRSPVDHNTLIRAAVDHVETSPVFAMQAGLTALRWILAGRSYDVTESDVRDAFDAIKRSASNLGNIEDGLNRVRGLLDAHPADRFVREALARVAGQFNLAG